ncbi:3-hydroxyacyl-ACP dehydratase FabZ [Candidatus Omnitrophota bacterium]
MQSFVDMNWLREVLPQKYPFFFIDRILSADIKAGRVVCLKNMTIDEYFFRGHFPDHPVVPGAFIIETLAQASIVLYALCKPNLARKKPDYYLGKVETKFLRPVKPGDQLILEVRSLRLLDTAGLVSAKALVDNQLAASAKISFGVKLKQ